MKKKLFSLCAALMLIFSCCFLAVSASAASDSAPLVLDTVGVLTDAEAADLNDYAEQLSYAYGMDVVLFFSSDMYGRTAQELADDYYDQYGFGQGDKRDGIALAVCPGAREYAFSTCGAGIDMFDDARLEEMDYAVVEYLGDNDWYGAAFTYLSTVESYFEQGMPEYPEEGFPFGAIPISLIMGFILSMMPTGIMRSKLKSVAKGREASDYIAKDGIHMTHSSDRHVNMFVTRHKIETSNSSSGSHSHSHSTTHVSSSGTTHGGRSGRF